MDSTIAVYLIGRLFTDGRIEWQPEPRGEVYSLEWCKIQLKHNETLCRVGKPRDWEPVCKKVMISAERLLELGEVTDVRKPKRAKRERSLRASARPSQGLSMRPLRQAV